MTNAGPEVTARAAPEAGPRAFVADVTAPSTPQHSYLAFRRSWERQVGEAYPAPAFSPGRSGDFRISAHATKVHDSVLADVHSESLSGRVGSLDELEDSVLMHVVERGTWSFSRLLDGGAVAAQAGHFVIRRSGPPTIELAPQATAKVLILPVAPLRALIGDRLVVGPAASAEMRVLLAHVRLLEATAHELTPAGAEAAHGALIELVKGAVRQRVSGEEPLLAPALATAARHLIEARLADPDLSPLTLARELHVSVRTLHRAFATAEESVTAYIRRRRLEQAQLELTVGGPAGPPSVTELAAQWQFADSSHFIRAFKKKYGQTPGEVARSGRRRS